MNPYNEWKTILLLPPVLFWGVYIAVKACPFVLLQNRLFWNTTVSGMLKNRTNGGALSSSLYWKWCGISSSLSISHCVRLWPLFSNIYATWLVHLHIGRTVSGKKRRAGRHSDVHRGNNGTRGIVTHSRYKSSPTGSSYHEKASNTWTIIYSPTLYTAAVFSFYVKNDFRNLILRKFLHQFLDSASISFRSHCQYKINAVSSTQAHSPIKIESL